MKRQVVAVLALLGVAGCAHERTAQRPGSPYSTAVGLPPEVAPITQTINRGLPPPDHATIQASAGVGANKGPERGRPVASTGAPDAAAPGSRPPAEPLAVAPAGGPGATASIPLEPAVGATAAASAAAASAPVETAPASAPTTTIGASNPPAGAPEPSATPAPLSAATMDAPPAFAGPPALGADAAPPSAPPMAELPAPAPAPIAAPTTEPATTHAPSLPVGPASVPLEVPPSAPSTPAAPEMPTTQPSAAPASIPLEIVPSSTAPDVPPSPTIPQTPPQLGPVTPPTDAGPAVAPIEGAASAGSPAVSPAARTDVMPPIEGAASAGSPAVSPAARTDVMPPIEGAASAGSPAVSPAARTDVMPPIEAPVPGATPAPKDPVAELVPVEAPGAAAPVRSSDPLLGANPPLMPDLDAPPPDKKVAPATAVASDVMPAIEAALPPAPSTPAALGEPLPPVAPPSSDVMPPIEAAPSTPAAPVEALPPVAPPSSEVPPALAPVPSLPAPQAAREAAKRDDALVRTGGDAANMPAQMTIRSDVATPEMENVSAIAARVGDDVITRTELLAAMKERGRKQFAGRKLRPDELQMLAAFTLDDMIDRSLVIQEAKRKLKDPKKYESVLDAADNVFRDHEVPALKRKYHVDDDKALKDALIADDTSFEHARENFRYTFISRGYLEQQLGGKFKVDLPEKRAYYNAHLVDFGRPAQITWREVVIETAKSRSRTDAYHRAEAVLARLRRGDDFAKVAETDSDGPTRKQGGRWQTRPGGYAVPAVNAALERLPVGQVSPIIEGPGSYHIVAVEERRDAGPARFDEVQDEIEETVFRDKSSKLTSEFIEKLRRQAYVWTVFTGTSNDPAVLRAKYTPPNSPSR